MSCEDYEREEYCRHSPPGEEETRWQKDHGPGSYETVALFPALPFPNSVALGWSYPSLGLMCLICSKHLLALKQLFSILFEACIRKYCRAERVCTLEKDAPNTWHQGFCSYNLYPHWKVTRFLDLHGEMPLTTADTAGSRGLCGQKDEGAVSNQPLHLGRTKKMSEL